MDDVAFDTISKETFAEAPKAAPESPQPTELAA